MRIIQITPGAGEGYDCENCLRDTSLVWALQQAGHDVELVTLYLPPIADRPEEQPDSEIFYGGINVYLQQKMRLFRKTPRWIDRLFDWPRLLDWASRQSGMTSAQDLGETTMSMLRGAEGHQTKELARLLAHLETLERPDVICLSNVLLAGLAEPIKQALKVPVICQLQDEDAFLDDLGGALAEKAWQLVAERARDFDGFVAVSQYYADQMRQRLQLTQPIEVVHSAIHAEGYGLAAHPIDPPTIGFLSPMLPTSGLDRLVEAYAQLRPDFPSLRLSIASSRGPVDGAFLQQIERRLAELGLTEEVSFLSGTDRAARIAFMQTLSIFSAPTRRGEAFGRFVLEALVSGVPVVMPSHGAFSEIVEATGGGLLVPPNDVPALTAALSRLLSDPDQLQALGQAGRQAVLDRFALSRAANELVAAFTSITSGART